MVYQKERLENGLAYIALIHKAKSKKPAFQTYIYKYLALIDIENLKRYGKTIFNLDYIALENGPVPESLYNNRDTNLATQPFRNHVSLERTADNQYIYNPIAEPDLDYFSDNEIDLIESIVEYYAERITTVKDLCRITHEEILAWRVAWAKRNGSSRVLMDLLDTFPGILQKEVDELTPIEETALYFNARP